MGNKSSTSSSSASGANVGSASSSSTIVTDAVTGSHVLRIDGYSQIRGIGVGKGIDSGVFRVGGYDWSVRCYPDGRSHTCADWISVSLCLRSPLSSSSSRGSSNTSRPVVMARFKFSLLDQDGEPVVPEYQVTARDLVAFSASNRVWGFDQFIQRNDDGGGVEGSGYLEYDDSFSVRCEVTVYEQSRPCRKEEFVKVPPSKLHRELAGVVWAGEPADVTFEVGGEACAAHRAVLAARSPVFRAELLGPMREPSSRRVRVRDMEPDVFRAMLHFVYTDTLPPPTGGTTKEGVIMAQHLLVAADRYDLKRLRLVCEEKLCSHVDRSNAAATLVLAEQHGCRGLKKACLAFLTARGNLKAAMETEGYQHLKSSCPHLLDELISKLAP